MHKEILSETQIKLLNLISFASKKGFYLVGGTAIALHIGHRESIDFDLFRYEEFDPKEIDNLLRRAEVFWQKKYVSRSENCTGVIADVKCTFFAYPFHIEANESFEKYIKIPDLLTLAAMKAYALGRRAKWKDYVDLYFIIRDYYAIEEVALKTKEIFQGAFNESIFREQLHYFDDIDYSEEVEYIIPSPPSDAEIREFLRKASLS
ncbi:MAG: nucleotidyl transferase AbiEii/AbiGii toxin family protein [Candidatus Gracilibacteria bacterium]|nr:nucleotidyl transferase AbiEii/AbiGii toxin family protein [Candidatus Gracilibacteria bacterium]